MISSDDMAKRALEHSRVLAKGIGPRGATSDAERRAAKYVRDELLRLGLPGVRLEPFRGAVSGWLPLAVAFSLAAWGMLAGMLLERAGAVVAALLYGLAAWLVYRELCPTLRTHFLRRRLWRGGSQNVVGVIKPRGSVARRVVLMSYLDSSRCPFGWRTDGRRRWAGRWATAAFLSLPVCAAVFVLIAVTGNVTFYWLALVGLVLQIGALIVSLHADHSPFGPGANHDAAGVGATLALAEQLVKTPLERTDVWVVATGCRETGGDGVRALLQAHRSLLADTTFIALEGVGAGERVVYLTGEGASSLIHTDYHPEACALAQRAAQGQDVETGCHRGGPTEIGLLNRSGFKGLAVSVWPKDGNRSAGRRQLSDTVETLDGAALARALAFVGSLVQAIDAAPQEGES